MMATSSPLLMISSILLLMTPFIQCAPMPSNEEVQVVVTPTVTAFSSSSIVMYTEQVSLSSAVLVTPSPTPVPITITPDMTKNVQLLTIPQFKYVTGITVEESKQAPANAMDVVSNGSPSTGIIFTLERYSSSNDDDSSNATNGSKYHYMLRVKDTPQDYLYFSKEGLLKIGSLQSAVSPTATFERTEISDPFIPHLVAVTYKAINTNCHIGFSSTDHKGLCSDDDSKQYLIEKQPRRRI